MKILLVAVLAIVAFVILILLFTEGPGLLFGDLFESQTQQQTATTSVERTTLYLDDGYSTQSGAPGKPLQ